MRGLLWVCTVPLLLACGAEHAARLDLSVEAGGDLLCVFAHGDGELLFARPYAVSELPAGERSLTFVAGDRTRESVTISARMTRAGLMTGRASALHRFREGTTALPLRVQSCQLGSPASLQRPGGTFAALQTPPTMLAADHDGDGRDELLALAADGTMHVLDADFADGGSYRDTELRSTEGRMVASADLDGDCRLDLIAAAPTGALVVFGSDGSSPSPVGDAALDAAAGVTLAGEAALVLAGPSGLLIVPYRTDAPSVLLAGAHTEVESADLDGDGDNDLVATGAAGARVMLASEAGLAEAVGALPPSLSAPDGRIATGDLDGDGAVDLVHLAGDTLSIGWNRGDGFFEARAGDPAVAPGASRLVVGDLSGDCMAEIVVLGADAVAVVYTRSAGAFTERARAPSSAVELALLDADGDGTLELALLDATGNVTLWRP